MIDQEKLGDLQDIIERIEALTRQKDNLSLQINALINTVKELQIDVKVFKKFLQRRKKPSHEIQNEDFLLKELEKALK
jgi:uncharacterized protein (UPF0335 family)